ncbi:MAG: sodium:proton antiporter, partial [Bacillota bacterium]|nr:sodium:proton antiporter [Bacillota bacterium]
SMILNAMYFLPSVIAIWSLPKEGKAKRVQVSPLFALALVLFIAVNFALGIGYRPIVHIVEMGIVLMEMLL